MLTGDAARIQTEFSASVDPASIDPAPIAQTLDEMRAAQRAFPPHVADSYEPLIEPIYKIYQALTQGGSVTVDGDAYRSDVLNFMESCNRWSGE